MKFFLSPLILRLKYSPLDYSHSIKLLTNGKNFCSKVQSIKTELNNQRVRLRFAPSPTGFMHIGGLRTAFINYLFAKKYNGDFILRIEDTDLKRVIKSATENVQEVLEWFDIKPDEGPFDDKGYGPYFQSQRKEIYKKYAYQLLDQGQAYRCFCDDTLLKLLRDQAKKNRNIIGYDNRCRNLSKEEIKENLSKNIPFSIRFKLTEGETRFIDLVKGEICVDLASSEPDFIILKSDEYPTYHLANIVDDHLMKITHVIRGLEWLKSTPKHLMLYEAFNWKPPQFAHLPLIRNPSGTKLSKRNEDTNIINLKRNGVFKEAILNYLVTIGGGFKTNYANNNDRIYDLDYFKQDFDEKLLRPNSSILDLKKIYQFNHLTMKHYFKEEPEELIKRLKGFILNDYKNVDMEQLEFKPMCRLIDYLLKNKVQNYQAIKEEYKFFWTDDFERDQTIRISFNIKEIKNEIIELFQKFDDEIDKKNFEKLKHFCEDKKFDYGPFLQLIRHSITGKIKGPKIKDLYYLLTKEIFIKRLEKGLDRIDYSNEALNNEC